jgi:hypothetical protein
VDEVSRSADFPYTAAQQRWWFATHGEGGGAQQESQRKEQLNARAATVQAAVERVAPEAKIDVGHLTTAGAFSEQTFQTDDMRLVISAHRPRSGGATGSRVNPKKTASVWSITQHSSGRSYMDTQTTIQQGMTYAAAVDAAKKHLARFGGPQE